MKYIALLRGINVGGNKLMDMKSLKALFEELGYKNVSTYINSGNVLFESIKKSQQLRIEIEHALKSSFGHKVMTLVKTQKEMQKIAAAIPAKWMNDEKQKTDVAYLFPEIDTKNIIDELPIKKEYIDIRYVKGALFWNIDRKYYHKSQVNKLITHKYYQLMTVRNINTARVLAK